MFLFWFLLVVVSVWWVLFVVCVASHSFFLFCFFFFFFFFCVCFFFLRIRRPPRSTLDRSSAASDVYKRQELFTGQKLPITLVADEQSARKILWEARERFRAQGIAKR